MDKTSAYRCNSFSTRFCAAVDKRSIFLIASRTPGSAERRFRLRLLLAPLEFESELDKKQLIEN